jgi:hypothetical protein
MIRTLSATLAAMLLLTAAAATPLSARAWKPDARASALDYSQIVDSRKNGDLVMVWWVVPDIFPAASSTQAPNTQAMHDILSRYTVVGIVHGKSAGGKVAFEPVATLAIADAMGRKYAPLAAAAVPPALGTALASLQAMVRQSLGPTGEGVRWFVFDASTVHACAPGRLSVPYGGETYIYDTPIPGCAK